MITKHDDASSENGSINKKILFNTIVLSTVAGIAFVATDYIIGPNAIAECKNTYPNNVIPEQMCIQQVEAQTTEAATTARILAAIVVALMIDTRSKS